ncbi:MAG: hypothetical protein EZS28_014180 [Streblomastix strix]|uniref:Ubiquitin-like domain-containing protein n=1 Tax=Streblomastix strix TaxID=222440 RepID=A0A5J4W616_9EUKA|nr:MAG: hypothetical protein EZS28_014180 [Streblomastix strix]
MKALNLGVKVNQRQTQFNLLVVQNMEVKYLRTRIAAQLDASPDQIYLTFQKKEVSDKNRDGQDNTLLDYNIRGNCWVQAQVVEAEGLKL